MILKKNIVQSNIKNIPYWIFIVAVLIAVLIILIVAGILYKVNKFEFFLYNFWLLLITKIYLSLIFYYIFIKILILYFIIINYNL